MSYAAGLAPLIVAAAGGDASTSVMPFVALGGVFVILAGGLLFFFGQKRGRGPQ